MISTLPTIGDSLRERLSITASEGGLELQDLVRKGLAELRAGHFEEALPIFEQMEEYEGGKALSKLGQGLALCEMGKYEEALNVLKSAFGLGKDKEVFTFMGVTLIEMEREKEALEVFDQIAEKWPDDPEVWGYRVPPLSLLGRHYEALESLEKSYALRHHSSDRGAGLYYIAALSTAYLGVVGITNQWLPDIEAGVKSYIRWRRRAKRDKQLEAFEKGVEEVKKKLSREHKDAVEEFELSVRLLSIKDPFKGWEALTREMGKVWPKDVSAVEAIREQRK